MTSPNVWDLNHANRRRYPNREFDDDNACVICGRPTTGTTMIEVAIDGTYIPEGDPRSETDEHSQGWWPIGSECRRLFP